MFALLCTGVQQPGQPATSQPFPNKQDLDKGKRFQEHKEQQVKKTTATNAQPSSAPAAPAPPSTSFVDPPKRAASFTDVVYMLPGPATCSHILLLLWTSIL